MHGDQKHKHEIPHLFTFSTYPKSQTYYVNLTLKTLFTSSNQNVQFCITIKLQKKNQIHLTIDILLTHHYQVINYSHFHTHILRHPSEQTWCRLQIGWAGSSADSCRCCLHPQLLGHSLGGAWWSSQKIVGKYLFDCSLCPEEKTGGRKRREQKIREEG